MQSNEVRIPKGEFDFSPTAQPCQYFKSSFAKSLSFCNNQTKSLDLEINFNRADFKVNSPPSLNFQTQASKGTAGAIKAARSLLFPLDNNQSKQTHSCASVGAVDNLNSVYEDVNGNTHTSNIILNDTDEDKDETTPTVEQLQNNVWSTSNGSKELVTIIQV